MDTRDPNLLRVHPLNRSMPRIKPGMPEWAELVRDICERGVQDCVSITADGLAQLGFPHVATDKAAKLYDEANFEPILSALATVIARADLRREAA